MHICTVATLCFPEKTVPRNYYYCVQDDNSLCLCFKSMYRTLFVADLHFDFYIFDVQKFPYLSKYKYQQSSSSVLSSSYLQHLLALPHIRMGQAFQDRLDRRTVRHILFFFVTFFGRIFLIHLLRLLFCL